MNQTPTFGLTHFALAVKDVVRTLRFYRLVFDMEVMYQEEKMIQLTTPGCHDILVFEETDREVTGDTGGLAHFGFRLRKAENMEVMYQKVLNAGGKVIDKGEFVPGSPYVFFKDPDGYTIEIWYERLPAPADNR